jgi:hypothetical protein
MLTMNLRRLLLDVLSAESQQFAVRGFEGGS